MVAVPFVCRIFIRVVNQQSVWRLGHSWFTQFSWVDHFLRRSALFVTRTMTGWGHPAPVLPPQPKTLSQQPSTRVFLNYPRGGGRSGFLPARKGPLEGPFFTTQKEGGRVPNLSSPPKNIGGEGGGRFKGIWDMWYSPECFLGLFLGTLREGGRESDFDHLFNSLCYPSVWFSGFLD